MGLPNPYLLQSRLPVKFQVSGSPAGLPHSRKKLGFASTLMVISNPDRAVTVKERDPITDRDLRRVPNKGVQRIACFEWSIGTGIGMPVPLLHSHGSVSDDSCMIP